MPYFQPEQELSERMRKVHQVVTAGGVAIKARIINSTDGAGERGEK